MFYYFYKVICPIFSITSFYYFLSLLRIYIFISPSYFPWAQFSQVSSCSSARGLCQSEQYRRSVILWLCSIWGEYISLFFFLLWYLEVWTRIWLWFLRLIFLCFLLGRLDLEGILLASLYGIQIVNYKIKHKYQHNKMMEKYLSMGRNYLKDKLSKFEPKITGEDYIADQVPGRLKEPLSVLQRQQIDIEDPQIYENYYKSYPSHHLSHFLLDKYKLMVQAEAEPPKYIPPAGVNSHIPIFDEKFEQKALLLREAIEEYDEGFTKNDEPIICMCVINFHHKRGTEIEYRYPKNKTIQALEPMLVHHAMPDSSHNKPQDYNFFNFEADYKGKKRMLFGVSYFKQIKLTQQMKRQNVDFTRSYLQKAVTILSTLPLFGYLKIKLSITTKVFFVKFTSFDIIQEAYKQLNRHMTESWPNMPITDLYIGSDLKSIIPLFEITDFYEIWKAVLYQKRVVVFGHSSSSVSSFILSLLSLFPGQSTFGIFSKPIAKYMQSLRELALPLRLFNSENFLSISFHIQDFNLLDKFKKSDKGNFLIGTTNRLLKQSNDFGIELFVNLQNCTVEKRANRRPMEALSKKQLRFLKELGQIIGRQKSLDYGSSEDCIRNHFHSFLKSSLVTIIQTMKTFQSFVEECRQFANQIKNEQQSDKAKFFPPILPREVEKIPFPSLLLQKSFANFRQFKNQNLPEIIKGQVIPSLYINNYDYFLRLTKQTFVSYNWQDKKLSFGNGENVKNFEGKQIKFKLNRDEDGNQLTKSVFVGKIDKGKYDKSGFYVDQFERYEGEYMNGVKEGYGKLIIGNQKFIGNFSNGLYQGSGQLLIGKELYVGEFKAGEKNGYGSIQGGDVTFEGIWSNGKPTISKEEMEAKQKPQEKQINQQKNGGDAQKQKKVEEPEQPQPEEKPEEVISEPKPVIQLPERQEAPKYETKSHLQEEIKKQKIGKKKPKEKAHKQPQVIPKNVEEGDQQEDQKEGEQNEENK